MVYFSNIFFTFFLVLVLLCIACNSSSNRTSAPQLKTKKLPALGPPEMDEDGKVDWPGYFARYTEHHPTADANSDGVLNTREYTDYRAKLHKYKSIVDLGDNIRFEEDLVYAKVGHTDLMLDLYLPPSTTKSYPLILWLHGGGWKGSSKDHCLLSWLCTKGFAVASVEFRSTDLAPFPNNIYDCKAAIRWLKANGEEYGIDKNRIIVSGHSSGGHLAALIATTGSHRSLEGSVGLDLDQTTDVQGLISIAGAINLKSWAATAENLALVMGLQREDAMIDEIAELCSPAKHISSDDPPILLLHGGLDNIVSRKHSDDFYNAYLKQGLSANLYVYENKAHGHRFVTDSEREPILEFLQQFVTK